MKIFVYIVVLLVLTVQSAFAERVIKVGAFEHSPMIFKNEDGKIDGYYVDVLNQIAELEGWKLEYVYGSWSDGLERIQSGEIDLVTSAAFTEERDKFLHYSDISSFTVWSILYSRVDLDIQDIFSVEGKRIGLMLSDVNGKHFRDLCDKFGIKAEFVMLNSFSDIFGEIQNGKLDGGVAPNTAGYSLESKFNVSRTPVLFNPFNLYFAVGEGKNMDIVSRIDYYLSNWKYDSNSPLSKFRDKWFYIDSSKRIPDWLVYSMMAVVALLVFSFVTNMVFRKKVYKATESYREINNKLEVEIVERKKNEQALCDAYSRLEEADKIKKIILNNLAHELRTPLNGILGFSRILFSECTHDENKEMLGMIVRSGERLNFMLNSVLTLSELDSGVITVNKEKLHLATFAESYLNKKADLIKQKNLKLDFVKCKEEAVIFTDRNLINLVLDQVIDNAVKFTTYGGITFECSALKDFCRITITDTGIGFDTNQVNLFEPFRQLSEGTNRLHEGMGIGLTLCKRICEMISCDIKISSIPTEGTSVIIEFARVG